MDNNERAIQIRAAKAYPILSDIAPENDLKNEQFLAYIKGATEQKKIDVEKACEWLKNALIPTIGEGMANNCADDFRKAMSAKTNPLFEQCLANADPDTRAEVRRNMELTWHKASEELPKEDGIYIVMLGRNSFVCALEFDAISKQWSIAGYQNDVKYWMPIPEIKED